MKELFAHFVCDPSLTLATLLGFVFEVVGIDAATIRLLVSDTHIDAIEPLQMHFADDISGQCIVY